MVSMQVVADFHLHSKYARATSKNLSLEELARGAKTKGLNLLGTGDFTHPLWLNDLRQKLKEKNNSGIFEFDGTLFTLTTEVSTIYNTGSKIKKVHHNIHAASFDVVNQINDQLSKFGNLSSDGRPTLTVSSPELVEILLQIDEKILIYPNHAWTPWFGVFGSKSGFDSMEECYEDQTKNIFALETGLSSDPAMNWRLSSLDKFTLISNSDAHSANPWRVGREANVLDLEKTTYDEIFDVIKNKDGKKFLFTIETDPNYGKYHFDGHRNCKVCLSPKESKKFNSVCPNCRRNMTVGVLNRIESLADREEGFVPKNAIPFKTLLPLYEIISFVTGTNQLYSKKVIEEQDKLIARFGNEINVLLNVSLEDLAKISNEKIADAIIKVREGKINYQPGYDGVYGYPLFEGQQAKTFVEQKTLSEFGSVV